MDHARLLAMFLGVLFVPSASALAEEKPIEIPLKDVWALDMPGTKALRRGLPASEAPEAPVVSEIWRCLSKEKGKPKGFVVSGSGLDALHVTRSLICGHKEASKSLPAKDEATVIFYSLPLASYVRLDEVDVDCPASVGSGILLDVR